MPDWSAKFVFFEEFSEDFEGMGGVDVGIHGIGVCSEGFIDGEVGSEFLQFINKVK